MRVQYSIIVFLALSTQTTLLAQDIPNKSYPSEPASKALSDTSLKGEVRQFSFNHSKLYPGTSRNYWVYIPKEYNPDKPACLYVCMDGVLFNAPTVFDYLISKKEMPITIGVFIQSGAIKNDTTIIRYNRTNEFDNMNDRFARFIEEEILPDVVKQKSSDGRPLNISPNANDHAISGASSGAICAFTAAWQRPDLFSRVFSAIGTYIGMRGGDQYPVLVRKTEPKAIRVYLQDNNNDTWNPLFGNWFKSNIDMEAALNFSGYEVTNMWQEGGHDSRPATAIFADAMRWLWKGWPGPVKSGWSANNMLRDILDTNEHWQQVAQNTVAQTIVPASGSASMPDGSQYSLQGGIISCKANGKATIMDKDATLGNALAVSPDKRQLVASGKHSHWLYDYIIQPDGILTDKQKLYWLHNPGNDDTSEIRSVAFDTSGNLYAATEIGVQVCDQNGRVRAIISLPTGPIASLWFGGEKLDTLFVTSAGKLYKRRLKVKGAPSSQKAIIPVSQGGG